MSISENISRIKKTIPDTVTLVAVSKFHPAEAVMEAYNAGQRVFGESRAQELVAKRHHLPTDIEWHFIGQLQTNKVKEIAPFIQMIQSLDSLKLLNEIEKQAAKYHRVIRVLLEIHIAAEETKSGFSPDECRALLETCPLQNYPHVQIAGLMGMATNTDDTDQIRREFENLEHLYQEIKTRYFSDKTYFNTLSMGMSADYPLAIEAGSTMVRIGSSIFGERD